MLSKYIIELYFLIIKIKLVSDRSNDQYTTALTTKYLLVFFSYLSLLQMST